MSDSNASSAPVAQNDVFILQEILIDVGMSGLGQGMFTILAGMAVYTLVHKGLNGSLPRQLLLAAVIALVLSTTIQFSCLWAICIEDMTQFGPNPIPTSALIKFLIADKVFSRINYFISDLIVVWRAWLLSDSQICRISLVVCIVSTFGCMIPELYFTIHTALDTNANSYKKPLLNLLLIVPLLATNAVATSIIAYKTWLYRSQIKVHFEQGSRGRIERILILLVESGFLYCGIWILDLIVYFIGNRFLQEIVTIVPFIAGIYPLSIILLAEHGQANDMSSAGYGSDTSQSMHFAPSPRRVANSNSIIQSIADHIQVISMHKGDKVIKNGEDIEVQVGSLKERDFVSGSDTHVENTRG